MGHLLCPKANDSVRSHWLRLVRSRNHTYILLTSLWKSLVLWIYKLGSLSVILNETYHGLIALGRKFLLDFIWVITINETDSSLEKPSLGCYYLRLEMISEVGEESRARCKFDVKSLIIESKPFAFLPLLRSTIRFLLKTFSISLLAKDGHCLLSR